jgi:diguanylate cyclase (GGDEF)-like protein/PAS domain S-box-containing protein
MLRLTQVSHDLRADRPRSAGVTKRSTTVRDTTRPAGTRTVHIVDARQGPLVGPGRIRRIAPFAVTATLSLLVAVPFTSWARPGIAFIGSIIAALTIVASVAVPWHLMPRWTQLLPPFGFLTATVLLMSGTDESIVSPFLTLSVLPLMWLAIYETRLAVASVAVLTGAALWLGAPVGNTDSNTDATLSIIVFVICAGGMGVTLNSLVSDARRVSRELRDQHVALQRAAMTLDVLPEHVSRYTLPDHIITYCNATWAEHHHVEVNEAIGGHLEDFLSADELVGLQSQLPLLSPDAPVLEDSVERAVPDNPEQWVHWIDRYLVGEHGDEILTIGRDVTARHNAEALLMASEERYRELADKSADVVWHFVLEPTPHFDYMSPSVEAILGYPAAYFVDDFNRMLDILDDASTAAIFHAIKGDVRLRRFDFRFRHANGSTIIGETRTTVVPGGLQGVSRDVTELRQLQADVAALALRDPLTTLANRRLFDELLDADVARTERSGVKLAVAFLDLDGFKQVNDTYGHDAGDIVLRETARRLRSIVRRADTVARIGGDEFVFTYKPDDSSSHHLIHRIDLALAAPIRVNLTTTVRCPASIGVADTDAVGYDRAALLTAADAAMYGVKRARHSLRLDASA